MTALWHGLTLSEQSLSNKTLAMPSPQHSKSSLDQRCCLGLVVITQPISKLVNKSTKRYSNSIFKRSNLRMNLESIQCKFCLLRSWNFGSWICFAQNTRHRFPFHTCVFTFDMQFHTGDHLPDVNKSLTFVNVIDCQHPSFAPNSEDTAIVGMLLSLRHVSMNSDQTNSRNVSTNAITRYMPGATGNTRTKLNNFASRQYDRIATFADVLDSKGTCFAFIFQNHSQSFSFFQPCIKTLEGVGEIFILEEPDPISNYLGTTQSIPIVDRCDRALPVLPDAVSNIPLVPLSSPPAGHTKYFCEHNLTDIQISRVYIQQSSCAGTFCDRQQELTGNQRCGCFFTNKQGNIVLSMDVTIKVPPSFSVTGYRTIHRFKSWRTSQIFVKQHSWKALIASLNNDSTDHKHRDGLRITAKKVVDFINQNGGWTCIGWIRTGSVQDESDTSGAMIASSEQDPHITYLYPTETHLATHSKELRDLQYDYADATGNDTAD